MKVLIRLCLLLATLTLVGAVWEKVVDDSVKKNTAWLEWCSVTFYYGFYIILVTAILCCTLLNFIRNKMGNDDDVKLWDGSKDMDNYSQVLSLVDNGMKGGLGEFDNGENQTCEFPESESQLRQRLKSVQEEIERLRIQLTSCLDSKAELESDVALLDKEKISAEMQFELDRVHGAVELQKLKKDNLAVRRQIQKILEEKEEAEKEAERLDRDVRISRSAAVDAEFLEERLGSVKKEAEYLKHQFSILALEKQRASSVLSEIPHLPVCQSDAENENYDSWIPDIDLDLMSLE